MRAFDGRHVGGGARETRTPDICLAKAALYQLSYGPFEYGSLPSRKRCSRNACDAHPLDVPTDGKRHGKVLPVDVIEVRGGRKTYKRWRKAPELALNGLDLFSRRDAA